jgi:integrase
VGRIYRAGLAGTYKDVRQLASRWYTAETLRLDRSGYFAEWLALERTEINPRDGSEVPLYTTLRASTEGDGEAWDAESIAGPQIESALRGEGLPIPARTSQEWHWLVSEFDERINQLSGWALDRQEGRRALPGQGALPHAPLSVDAPAHVIPVASSAPTGPTVSQVFKAYKDSRLAGDKSRSVRASHKDYESSIEAFIELYGDLAVGRVTRELVGAYHVDLPKLPSNGKGMANLTPRQKIDIAERENLPRIALGTVRNRMVHLSAVLSFAVTRGWISENPIKATGIGRQVRQAAAKQQSVARRRKHYEASELAAIFSSPAFVDRDWTPPRATFGRAWYWLPVLMFYSGARVEELAQLMASEVRLSREGVHYLSILESSDEADGERTVKTAGSRRAIPLHPDVLARGFIAYVKAQPAGGRLFPGLEPCPKGRYSTNFAKSWGRYLREIVRLESPASPSHGFRHTFKTLARRVKMPEDVHDAITGHARGGVGRTYGEMPLPTMAVELARLPSISEVLEMSVISADC